MAWVVRFTELTYLHKPRVVFYLPPAPSKYSGVVFPDAQRFDTETEAWDAVRERLHYRPRQPGHDVIDVVEVDDAATEPPPLPCGDLLVAGLLTPHERRHACLVPDVPYRFARRVDEDVVGTYVRTLRMGEAPILLVLGETRHHEVLLPCVVEIRREGDGEVVWRDPRADLAVVRFTCRHTRRTWLWHVDPEATLHCIHCRRHRPIASIEPLRPERRW